MQIALGELALSIEDVGSTSGEGVAAKPIIDIDVVIARESFSQVKKSLAAISYSHEGNLGIEDREAFSYSGKDHLRAHTISMSAQVIPKSCSDTLLFAII